MIVEMSLYNELDRIVGMKTSEIINSICSQLGIAKAELAKRMGIYPSSLYRKLSRESMTFEELQKSLDALGVSMELQFQYPDGRSFSSGRTMSKLWKEWAFWKRCWKQTARLMSSAKSR